MNQDTTTDTAYEYYAWYNRRGYSDVHFAVHGMTGLPVTVWGGVEGYTLKQNTNKRIKQHVSLDWFVFPFSNSVNLILIFVLFVLSLFFMFTSFGYFYDYLYDSVITTIRLSLRFGYHNDNRITAITKSQR